MGWYAVCLSFGHAGIKRVSDIRNNPRDKRGYPAVTGNYSRTVPTVKRNNLLLLDNQPQTLVFLSKVDWFGVKE